MMKDLISYINQLVDDQVQMRSCIPLTTELHDFYVQLMGRDVDEEEDNLDSDDEEDLARYERFLIPKKKKRNAVTKN